MITYDSQSNNDYSNGSLLVSKNYDIHIQLFLPSFLL